VSSRRSTALVSMVALAGLSLASLAGCAHAKHVEPPNDDEDIWSDLTATTNRKVARSEEAEPSTLVDAPEKLLRPGAGQRIQEALRSKGYVNASSKEELGAETIAVIQRFQQESGLAATGFPDAETLRLLDLDPDRIYKRLFTPDS
jgi:murein L,D-transpeptidase YcbB/YkuD